MLKIKDLRKCLALEFFCGALLFNVFGLAPKLHLGASLLLEAVLLFSPAPRFPSECLSTHAKRSFEEDAITKCNLVTS